MLFPITTVLPVKLVEDLAGGVELAKVEVGLDEIIAHHQSVGGRIEVGGDDLEDFRQMSGIAQITTDLLEQVSRSRFAGANEAFVIEG
jgi:hypothetical protein